MAARHNQMCGERGLRGAHRPNVKVVNFPHSGRLAKERADLLRYPSESALRDGRHYRQGSPCRRGTADRSLT
jgi:hypothetical protein